MVLWNTARWTGKYIFRSVLLLHLGECISFWVTNIDGLHIPQNDWVTWGLSVTGSRVPQAFCSLLYFFKFTACIHGGLSFFQTHISCWCTANSIVPVGIWRAKVSERCKQAKSDADRSLYSNRVHRYLKSWNTMHFLMKTLFCFPYRIATIFPHGVKYYSCWLCTNIANLLQMDDKKWNWWPKCKNITSQSCNPRLCGFSMAWFIIKKWQITQ